MDFKEWYDNKENYADMEDNTKCIPAIKIEGEVSVDEVTKELDRLGFGRGNDFSKFGLEINVIDIWYADFYNLFHSYDCVDEVFWVSLDELKKV